MKHMKHTTPNNQSRCFAKILPQLSLWLAILFVPLVLAIALKVTLASSSEQIKVTGAINVPRAGHTATLLTNGPYADRVLIAGGVDASGEATASAELYDPATGIFDAITPMSIPRTGHKALMLDGGFVLISGGDATDSSEVFDAFNPLNGWVSVPSAPIPDLGPVADLPYATAIELANTRLLLFGPEGAGIQVPGTSEVVPLENSEALHRAGATATELAGDKKVLVAGGLNNANELIVEAAVFNPARVVTDKDDYAPGATANITASGFLPGETVTFRVLHADHSTPDTGEDHEPWEVTDGGDGDLDGQVNGSIQTTWHVCEDDCRGKLLELTANGLTSGLSAETQFTDETVTVYEDPTFCTNRNAFAWGSTVYAAVSAINPTNRCIRLLWIDPNGVVVSSNELGTAFVTTGCLASTGTSSIRTNSFTIPACGPSGQWTVIAFRGGTVCSLGTFTLAGTAKFDVARYAVVGAFETNGPSSHIGGDNFVQQDHPGTVEGPAPQGAGVGTDVFVKSHSTQKRRGFVRFELSNAGILGPLTKAQLRWWDTKFTPATVRTVDVYRVLVPWGETNITWSSAANQAGGVVGTATDSATIPINAATNIYWNVTGDVSGFLAGTSTNFGWRLSDRVETGPDSPTQETGFKSTENDARRKDLWPTLLIDTEALPCSIDGTNAVCANSTGHIYTGPAGSDLAYSWTVGTNAVINGSSTGQSVMVNAGGAAGIFTLTLTLSNTVTSCVGSCTKEVTVITNPSCSITGTNLVCSGTTTNYSGNPGANLTNLWAISGSGTFVGGGTTTNGTTVSVVAGAFGSYTLSLTVSNTVTGCSSTCTKIVSINRTPQLSLIWGSTSTQTVQYSDMIVPVFIRAIDTDGPGMLTSNVTWSANGGAFQAGLPSALSLTYFYGSPGSSATWMLSGQMLRPASTNVVRVCASDGMCSSCIDITIIVTKEDAFIVYDPNNPMCVPVTAPGSNIATNFALLFKVKEQPDSAIGTNAAPGAITNAPVVVKLIPIGPGPTITATNCTNLVMGASGTYQTNCIACLFTNVPLNTYVVSIQVTSNANGCFYKGGDEQALVVCDPSLGFATGGGKFIWPDGSGDLTTFGGTFKFTKGKGGTAQGNLLVIRHATNGLYRLKGNAITGLSIGQGTDGTNTFGWASATGKGTYQEPTWPDAVGNYGFTVYMEDRNEPGTGIDRFWLSVTGGSPLTMSPPATNNAVAITGGNIAIPHTTGRR